MTSNICLSGLEVDHQLHFRGLNYWQISWLSTVEDASSVNGSLPTSFRCIRAIAHQAARRREFSVAIDSRQTALRREADQLIDAAV
jgi:hypothetical protein